MDRFFAIVSDGIHRFEGTINQFTGDGVMALFGAPIAHEAHAARALHAALDIQAALRAYGETAQKHWAMPFQMRLGLNTGLVVVGRIGDDLRMDYTAQGDTVNLAARIQQMAPPGGIWMTEATSRAAGDGFDWDAIGPMPVKGKSAPVTVYELRGRREARSRFEAAAPRALTRFVGRDVELEQLQAAWAEAQLGHGRVISVVGEAGLGKSRLLYEFKRQLSESRARYLEGTCFTYGESISYLPFLGVVRACCGLTDAGTDAVVHERIEAHLASLALEPSTVVPYLENLLYLSVEDPTFSRLTPDVIRQRTVAAITRLVVAEARGQPFVLILEDLHWIDKATEEVIGALVEAMADLPLLLVLAYRPEYMHAWAGRAYHGRIALSGLATGGGAAMVRAVLSKPYASKIPLAPLAPAQSAALAQDILGTAAAVPAELAEVIVARTDGNPLFIEELTRSLRESGVLVRTPDGYALARPVASADLPTTVEAVLLARIDRLSEDLKDVLQVAAVIGRVFSYPLLAHVIERGAALDETLLELADLEFIYPTALSPQREYSFKHVLTQEAVYSTLLRASRATYHERIGQAVEALYRDRLDEYYELLAYHYVRSGDGEKAVEYLDLANRKATKANAMEEAKRHFDEAMTLLDTLPESGVNRRRRIVMLVNQQVVMDLLLKHTEYHDWLARYEATAVGLADGGLLGSFYGCMGYCQWAFGDYDRAIDTLAKAAELCEAAGKPEEAAVAYCMWQWSHLFMGDFDRVLSLKTQVLRMLEQQSSARWNMWALTAASWAYVWLGQWPRALDEASAGLRIGEEFSDDSVVAFAALSLCMAHAARGDHARAAEYGELAVDKATTLQDRMWAQGFLGWAWCRAGQPHRGVEILATLVPIYRASPFAPGEILALCLGEAYWLAGERDKAVRTLEEHLQFAERFGMKFHIGAAHRLLGELARLTDPARAAAHFERSIAALHAIKAENELALAYAGHGRLLAEHGQRAEGRAHLARALAIFERLGTLGEPDKVRRMLDDLPA